MHRLPEFRLPDLKLPSVRVPSRRLPSVRLPRLRARGLRVEGLRRPQLDLDDPGRLAAHLQFFFYLLMFVALLAIFAGAAGTGVLALIAGAALHVLRSSLEEVAAQRQARRERAGRKKPIRLRSHRAARKAPAGEEIRVAKAPAGEEIRVAKAPPAAAPPAAAASPAAAAPRTAASPAAAPRAATARAAATPRPATPRLSARRRPAVAQPGPSPARKQRVI